MDKRFLQLSEAVRQAMDQTDSPVALGWEVLNRSRRAHHVHLTDKELFMAGAGYMFDALVHALDPTKEDPSDKDLAFVTKIHSELQQFHLHFKRKFPK